MMVERVGLRVVGSSGRRGFPLDYELVRGKGERAREIVPGGRSEALLPLRQRSPRFRCRSGRRLDGGDERAGGAGLQTKQKAAGAIEVLAIVETALPLPRMDIVIEPVSGGFP
jgi:hypothetical protein